MSTKKIATMSVLAAMSLVLLVFRIPYPIAPFLEYDFADVPIIICTMIYGPLIGLTLTSIVCIIQGLVFSAASGVIGVAMHFFATGIFVLVFGLIYRKFSSVRGAIIGAIVGIFFWVGGMVIFNILLTPLFLNCPMEAVYPLLLPAIVPFNLIKATSNSAISLILFYALNKVLKLHSNRIK